LHTDIAPTLLLHDFEEEGEHVLLQEETERMRMEE